MEFLETLMFFSGSSDHREIKSSKSIFKCLMSGSGLDFEISTISFLMDFNFLFLTSISVSFTWRSLLSSEAGSFWISFLRMVLTSKSIKNCMTFNFLQIFKSIMSNLQFKIIDTSCKQILIDFRTIR